MQNKKIVLVIGLLVSLIALPAQAADFTDPECRAQNGGCHSSATTCIAPDYVVGGCINSSKEPIGVCCVSSGGNGSVCQGPSGKGTCKDSSQCASGDVIPAPGACATGRVCCKLPNLNPTPGNVGKLSYTLLEQIPGPGSTSNLDLPGYLQALYKFSLWAIGIAALFMLSVGGFLYVTSAGNTARMGTAKEIIADSLIGLALALVAWLFLFIINPDFTKLKLPTVTDGVVVPPGTGPPPPAGSGSGCGGLGVSGISPSQCNDASQPLADVLNCIKGKVPEAKITSISDSAGFTQCKTNWNRPPCAHSATSCHYGGGVSKTAAECQKSHAADLSVKDAQGKVDMNLAQKIKTAGAACGGRVNDELAGSAPHIHISDQTACCTL